MKPQNFRSLLAFAVLTACCAAFPAAAFAGRGDPSAGKQSFATICASCHGDLGKGDGIAAAALDPKPRDLSDAAYMSGLTDEYLFKVINEGGVAVGKSVAMPAWGGVLGEDGVWNVVAYIREGLCKCEHAPQ